MLESAYDQWSLAAPPAEATDDASIVEAARAPIRLIRDRGTNLKITTAEDFVLAEALAAR
jgi:2-C-methyl-D-erythritol 4-phosphate cytidylyltransferase